MATFLLPHSSTSVRSARRRLAGDLRAQAVEDGVVDDAVLVISELLSNALKHARPLESGKVRAAWNVRNGTLEVEVTDGGGPTYPRTPAPSVSGLGGRGLSIVASLSSDWGVREGEGEITVWAALPLPAGTSKGSAAR
ncbi:MAG: ATP-binding protein [Streptomycetales bacterium]